MEFCETRELAFAEERPGTTVGINAAIGAPKRAVRSCSAADSQRCAMRLSCDNSYPKPGDLANRIRQNQRMTTTHPPPLSNLWRNRRLIGQLAKRDIVGRYRGSMLGILWSLFNPLFLLAVYTFVFSSVFKMKWGLGIENTSQFAIVVFAGLIVHGFFAECAGRAPGLVVGNANYVKRVVFPLEVLPCVTVVAALFHTAVSLFVLFAFILLETGSLHWTASLTPIVLLPLVILTVGVCWFLAAIGVYLRDVGQTIGLVVTLLLFLSPVFYPIQAVPAEYRDLIYLNFLTFIIEQVREVAVFGRGPDWFGLLLYTALSVVVAWLGLVWFKRSRRGFADVL